jgi:hypothetical protein
LGAGTVLVSAHDSAADHRVFVVGIGGEMLKYPLPNIGFCPAAETHMHRHTFAEALRQVEPGYARPVAIQHRLDEQPIVSRFHTNPSRAPGKQMLNTLPLVVTQGTAAHRSAPLRLTLYESNFPARRNPLIEDRR